MEKCLIQLISIYSCVVEYATFSKYLSTFKPMWMVLLHSAYMYVLTLSALTSWSNPQSNFKRQAVQAMSQLILVQTQRCFFCLQHTDQMLLKWHKCKSFSLIDPGCDLDILSALYNVTTDLWCSLLQHFPSWSLKSHFRCKLQHLHFITCFTSL